MGFGRYAGGCGSDRAGGYFRRCCGGGEKTAHAVGTNSADITAAKTSGKSGSAEASGKSGSAKTSGSSGGAETEALGVDEGEVSGSENEAAFDYKTVSGQLEEIEKSIRKKQFTRQSLDDAAAFLTQQEIVIEFAAKGIEKNSKYVQDALNALGPEPVEGENEDPAIAEMRSKYTAVMNNYKNRLIEANLLKTEMARLNSIISEARSRIIIGNLVAEQNVLIAPHNFLRPSATQRCFSGKLQSRRSSGTGGFRRKNARTFTTAGGTCC